ncbi:MAG: heavy-metal-associated domain-containing protein [Methanosphaera stadtmanae]|nr:heavy-metal-associated domain-containing protein [Methanosphaera stadtmanae]
MSNTEKTFVVENMTCKHCVANITRELKENDDISDVNADLDSKEVVVTYDDEKITSDEIINTLHEIEYEAQLKE